MKVILFGASGLVGQGALRECLLDPEVEAVLAVGRSASGQHHAKLKELVQEDVGDLTLIEHELKKLRLSVEEGAIFNESLQRLLAQASVSETQTAPQTSVTVEV